MSSITRIYVCGAHSTGKTTLINDLKPHLKNIRVEEEIARNIIRKYNWNRDDFLPDRNPGNFEKLNTEILMTHIEIDQENESKGIDFICDRCIDPLVYTKIHLGDEAVQKMLQIPGLDTWTTRLEHSLVFVIEPHEECIADDSVRMMSPLEDLLAFTEVLTSFLRQFKIPYVTVSMLERNQRRHFVLDKIRLHNECVVK